MSPATRRSSSGGRPPSSPGPGKTGKGPPPPAPSRPTGPAARRLTRRKKPGSCGAFSAWASSRAY